ncbi:WG repeat-containing protein [Arachidicoccus soli]|uniref:WG repeat-containing protein n=1 Tax=Arachidicoccus soli TaxID=2341117 RepID=A0A386HQ12_9BACT|nr:WG repeat-containing protein [Arachidicoccus soli]AYD47782.1 WG repeat-containing protein [Arachidicoccus soli]
MKDLFFILLFISGCYVVQAQDSLYDGGSHFAFGFAHLEKGGQSYFIDRTGKIAFNEIVRGGFQERTDFYEVNDSDRSLLPQSYVEVRKGNKLGILTIEGKWILNPIYDSIDTQGIFEWIVKKYGKKSLFTSQGFELPFRFDMAYRMDSNYYQVVNKGLFGIYSKKEDKLVVPIIYQNMDYCYSCEAKGNYSFAEKNGKWGVINFQNKVLLPFEYDHHHWNMRSDEWVNCLYKNGKQLAINLHTKQVDTCNFAQEQNEDTTQLAQGFRLIRKKEKYGLLNPAGKLVLAVNYDFINYEADTVGGYLPAPFVAINQNNLWGIADTTGRIIIPPLYNSELHMVADSFFLCHKADMDILLNKNGGKVFKGKYDDIQLEHTDNDSLSIPYFLLKQNNHYGIYNPQTDVWVQPKFDGISQYLFRITLPNVVKIKLNDQEGLLNVKTGKLVVQPIYHSLDNEYLPKGLMIVRGDEKYGLYNYLNKKLVAPLSYRYLGKEKIESLILTSTSKGYGLMNFDGKEIIPNRYFEIRALSNDFYLLTRQDSTYQNIYSFFNSKNNHFTTLPFDTIDAVEADTLIIVIDKGKYKLYNLLTEKVIDGAYSEGGFPDLIQYFSNGYAIVQKNKKAGIINAKGDFIIPLKYAGLSNFHNGYALMLKGEDSLGRRLYGFIDSTGKVVIPAKYVFDVNKNIDDYFPDSYLLLIYQVNEGSPERIGLATRKGKVLIPPAYDKIIAQKNGFNYLVEKDKKFGILDSLGQIILPITFDDISLNEVPIYESHYAFEFPLLAQKGKLWQYYNRNGKSLPIKVKKQISFNPIINF